MRTNYADGIQVYRLRSILPDEDPALLVWTSYSPRRVTHRLFIPSLRKLLDAISKA